MPLLKGLLTPPGSRDGDSCLPEAQQPLGRRRSGRRRHLALQGFEALHMQCAGCVRGALLELQCCARSNIGDEGGWAWGQLDQLPLSNSQYLEQRQGEDGWPPLGRRWIG